MNYKCDICGNEMVNRPGHTNVCDKCGTSPVRLVTPTKDNMSQADGGVKTDEGKVRLDLVHPIMMIGAARVLQDALTKYEEWNWSKGMRWGRVSAALLRHMFAWMFAKGPTSTNFLFGDTDSETGYSHLWHAACCLMFLMYYEEYNVGEDDRFRSNH